MSRQKEQIKEFTRMTAKELRSVLVEKKESLRQLKFDISSGKTKSIKLSRETRKDIARIETVIKIKESETEASKKDLPQDTKEENKTNSK